MKILLVSQYFWPEAFRINDLALELVKRGHQVTVLTGKPNYPSGRFFNGYGFFSKGVEYFEGVKVVRVPIIPRGNGNGIKLALNYLSYALIASIYSLLHRKHYDVSLTFATSPITAAFPALMHKRVYKTPSLIWVQDLWPESVAAASSLKSPLLMKLLTKMVRSIYQQSDRILISSRGFRGAIVSKYQQEDKIVYIPNWAEDLYSDATLVDRNRYKSIIPSGFVVMFAGNIGEAQDFENILKSAEETVTYSDIKWVLIGDGRKKKWVEEEVERRKLTNVYLLGRYPISEMPSFFYHADVMLMSLKDEEIFSLTVPSKLQSYMAFGKPIVTMLNGEGSQIVNDADCGYIANASNFEILTSNVINAYNNVKNINELGQNGKRYYAREFKKDIVVSRIENIISKLEK